jgi:hypothetical protein
MTDMTSEFLSCPSPKSYKVPPHEKNGFIPPHGHYQKLLSY